MKLQVMMTALEGVLQATEVDADVAASIIEQTRAKCREASIAGGGQPAKLYVRGTKPLPAKCAPQMRVLAKAIDETPRTGAELAGIAVETHGLATRQDPVRIFAWYRKALLDSGYMVEHTGEVPSAETPDEQPAKTGTDDR